MIVEPHLGLHRMGGGHPMQGALDLAPVRRVAAPGFGVVGRADFDHIARRVLDDVRAGDEKGIAQAHLAAGP